VHSNKGEPGRRLQGIFELMGLFNSLPIFAGWNSTFDSPPRMPLSFTADAWVMYSCVQRGTDMCKRFNLQTHMFNGESYTRSKVYLQADDGMKYERHEDLVRLPGWRYEKYTLDGVAHQSQTWKQTGDRFHCRSNATDLIVPVGSLDPTKFLASFAGETVVDGETWNKIVLKGREAQMMTVEYWVAMQRSSVSGDFEAHPRVIQFTRGPYDPDPSGPEHGNSLRFAYLFDRFTPQDGESGRFISFDGQDLPGVPFQCQQDAQESDGTPISDAYPFRDLGSGPQYSNLNVALLMNSSLRASAAQEKAGEESALGGLKLASILKSLYVDADTEDEFKSQYVQHSLPSTQHNMSEADVYQDATWALNSNPWARGVYNREGASYLLDLIKWTMHKVGIHAQLLEAFDTAELSTDEQGRFLLLLAKVEPAYVMNVTVEALQAGDATTFQYMLGLQGMNLTSSDQLNSPDPSGRRLAEVGGSKRLGHGRALFAGAESVGCGMYDANPGANFLLGLLGSEHFKGCAPAFYSESADNPDKVQECTLRV